MDKFDLILFDMDGTLTDTMRLQPYLAWKFIANKKLSFKEVQKRMAVIYYLNKYTWFSLRTIPLFVRQFKTNYLKILFLSPILVFQYLRAIHTKERTFNNVRENLEKLKKNGYTIGLVTNGLDFEVKNKVPSISDVFDLRVTASDVSKKKPDPEMILKGVKMGKSTIKKTLYVGDTIVDMLASKNAGCSFALMTTGTFGPSVVRIGENKPDFIFETNDELVDWLIK